MKPARTTELLYTASSGENLCRPGPPSQRRTRFRDGLGSRPRYSPMYKGHRRLDLNQRPPSRQPQQGRGGCSTAELLRCPLVPSGGVEPPTSPFSGERSYQLSYKGVCVVRTCRGSRTRIPSREPHFECGAYTVPPDRHCVRKCLSPDSNREHTGFKSAASTDWAREAKRLVAQGGAPNHRHTVFTPLLFRL